MSKGRIFIGFTVAEILLLLALIFSSLAHQERRRGELAAKQELVRHLGLTDFAVWTEARYTRHPSQADFFSPFQDFPASLDHFPAGTVIAPVYSFDKSSE
ncbi:MAG: hypothetical protein ACYCYR_15235 [Desulfobulbaceae bacterium]